MDLIDLSHAMVLEGADPGSRMEADEKFEQGGHEMRAAVDERYKRATWGLRPEDFQAQQELMGGVAGRRVG